MSETEKPLVNRVAKSPLVTLDLEQFAPEHPIEIFDLEGYLWQGLVLKEKDFRDYMAAVNWSSYQGKILLVQCSADAIIPTWAYMLVAAQAEPFAESVFVGTREEFLKAWFETRIAEMDTGIYADGLIVVKGCGSDIVPVSAYVTLVNRLRPVVRSLMYGEPCSTVPVYKRPRKI